MRLKSIEMQGFKSFPDKTKITFNSGVTAIIGPNGSGKSNISDAMRWVLGEMSLKSLRGKRMEDVIFNGTASRPPSNYTSVSITLDTEEEFNEAQNSVMDFGAVTEEEKSSDTKKKATLSDHKEISITRKYYRSGESEYYINKTQVRLKDIYELFYDTGIGREGYSVIGQGKIAEVLSQKGDERRSIFEEAAGISKFRHKKAEAERKLNDTENNLIRINDILGEVSARIGPLAKEAENAKQYLVLSEEKKGLEITLWLDKIDDIKSQLNKSEIDFNSAKYELEQKEERLLTLEESLDNIINENYELSRVLSETERKKSEANQSSSEAEAKKAVFLNDIAHFERVIRENEQAVSSVSADIMSTSRTLEEARTEAKEKQEQLSALSEEADAEQSNYESKHTEVMALRELLDRASLSYSDIYEQNTSFRTTGARIEAELELAGSSIETSIMNLSESEKRITDLKEELKKASEAKLEKRTELDALLTQSREKANEADQSRKKREEIKKESESIRLLLAADEQKREHLNRMEQLLEGYSESVRTVVSDSKHGKIRAGGKPITVHGTVSSLISTEGEYVVALETALAAAVQFVVVDGEEDAKAAILHLKDKKAGRATFLPLSTVKGRKCDVSEIKDIKGYIGIASELAEFDKKYQGIIDNLLGKTVIASDIDSAAMIAKKSGYRIKIVTADGQVINAGGSFTGGSSAKKVGLLTRAVDIEQLSAEIKKKNSLLLAKDKEHSAVQDGINRITREITSLEAHINEEKSKLDALVAEFNTASIRLDEEKKRRDALSTERSRGEERLLLLKKQKEEFSVSAKADEQRLEEARALLNDSKEKYRAAQEQEETAYGGLNALRLSVLELRSECERRDERVGQLEERIKGCESRIEELNILTEKTKENISERKRQIEALDGEKDRIQEEIKGHEEELQKLLSGREDKEKEINRIRSAVKQSQSEKEEAFRRYTSLEAKQSKLNDSYEDLSSRLWDEYELTYSSALPYRLPKEKMQKAPSRLNSLKSRIRSMGSINVNAVEEYKKEKERFDFLTAQTDDLNKTRRSLDSAIARLSSEMKQTFVDCFNNINAEFGTVFSELFGGGKAYIELENPDYPLECGIEIIIKPPGKSVRNISLLSGGEQSFAAIALYLALQKVNPAPFCIFDEIESALDDINLVKFADYIRQNSSSTQYILITHRRGTMERADTLYGITMRQKGISDYIKLNVSRLEENIKEYTN